MAYLMSVRINESNKKASEKKNKLAAAAVEEQKHSKWEDGRIREEGVR